MNALINKPPKTNPYELEKQFRRLGTSMGFWKYGYALRNNCRQVFRMNDFAGHKILEIGCGKGMYCLWAGIFNADYALGLEPLSEGSASVSNSCFQNFKKIADKLKLNNVEILSNTVQEYKCADTLFDIVLSINSINHLDEISCIRLRESAEAKEKYLTIFRKIGKIMANDGKIIIIDASKNNYFGDRDIKNPFIKNIEWINHHQPEYWAELLSMCGFENPRISWNSGKLLRYMGIMSISKTLSYFSRSHFRLEMTLKK